MRVRNFMEERYRKEQLTAKRARHEGPEAKRASPAHSILVRLRILVSLNNFFSTLPVLNQSL